MEDSLKILKVEYLRNQLLDHTQILNLSLNDKTIFYNPFKWWQPPMEDDLKILKAESLSHILEQKQMQCNINQYKSNQCNATGYNRNLFPSFIDFSNVIKCFQILTTLKFKCWQLLLLFSTFAIWAIWWITWAYIHPSHHCCN